jgi:hypothetical protein
MSLGAAPLMLSKIGGQGARLEQDNLQTAFR